MTHAERTKHDEKLPPGVISIKPPPRFGMFGSMLIRLGLACLLLAAGVLAVYYSIEVHSDSKNDEKTEISKTYFTLNRTQYCLNGGILTRENHTGWDSEDNHIHNTTKIKTQWAQSVEEKKLFFSVGIPRASDWESSYYVFENSTIIVTPNGKDIICRTVNIGYDSFTSSFGLENLFYIRSEQIVLDHDDDDEEEIGENIKIKKAAAEKKEEKKDFISVNFFQGDPSANGGYKFTESIPFLGIGYMDSTNSIAIAWQMYFQEDPKPANTTGYNSRYFEEFWFPEMKQGHPPIDVFSYPMDCVKGQ